MSKDEALKMAIETIKTLWKIIDDIDTYGDVAKSNNALYREFVEKRQRDRFKETGISTDGYELNGGAINACKEALEQPAQEPVLKVVYGEICYLSKEDDQSYGMWCPVTENYKPPFKNETNFYTHPHQDGTSPSKARDKEFVTLTDDEIDIICEPFGYFKYGDAQGDVRLAFARAIEQVLKEKNT